MSLSILPAVPIRDLTITDDGHQFFLTLWIAAACASCPHCGQVASRIHSTYARQVQDLPWSEAAVLVELVVPKWWCDNPECPQRIFCMRLTPWVPAYGRRSVRLTEWIADWAWTTSAEEMAATATRGIEWRSVRPRCCVSCARSQTLRFRPHVSWALMIGLSPKGIAMPP